MPESTISKPSARERLLDAADDLFYSEGVHVVGIDRVIERAGVAKASLYSTFGSKDKLVDEYLLRRNLRMRARIADGLERFETPRDKLLGVFDVQGEWFADAGFRGCSLYAASAESPRGCRAESLAHEYRAWIRDLFAGIAREAGATDAAAVQLADQLGLLYDGAATGARLGGDPTAANAVSRGIAETLINAALPA